jgi:hypothetical protein
LCCNFWYLALGARSRIQKNLTTNRCSDFSISQLWRPTHVRKLKTFTTWWRKDKWKYHISHLLSLNHSSFIDLESKIDITDLFRYKRVISI